MIDALSIFSINGNQETTHESTYQKEIVSEINDTKELPECIFPINLNQTNQHQQKYPILKDKYIMGT